MPSRVEAVVDALNQLPLIARFTLFGAMICGARGRRRADRGHRDDSCAGGRQSGAQCSKQSGCQQTAYLDGKQKKIYSFNRTYKCKKSGSSLSAYMSGQPKFKRGKVTFKMSVTSVDSGEETVLGTSTVKAKLKKKKRLTGSWKIDEVADGCKNVAKGKFKLKYKGPLYGG